MKYVLTTILLFTFYVASGQDVSVNYFPPHVKVVIVSNEQAWTSTGITVNANDSITIIMNGIAAADGSTHSETSLWIGPEGMGSYIAGTGDPLPGVALFSVIGKIGTNGNPFYVGRNCSFKSNVSGELILGLNDQIFFDNYGYYVAFITGSNRQIFPSNKVINTDDKPRNISLSQNFPNPFNPSTTINYSVPATANVQINVFDLNGRLIKSLVNETKNAGQYSISWDSKDGANSTVASGTYFYQVQIGNFVQAKKMLLVK